MDSRRGGSTPVVIIVQAVFFLAQLQLLAMVAVVRSAPAEDLITSLPGQPPVTFKQYGGYVTVDAKNGRALYYYFVEAETKADSKPLTLWLNGGPGCSSLGGGAFTELGPFYTLSKSLFRNGKAWNKVSNVLFLESPAGVGFSYSNTTSDYDTGDAKTGTLKPPYMDSLPIHRLNVQSSDCLKELQQAQRSASKAIHLGTQDSLTFLLKWFKKFPEYQPRDFFITGESYAGHYGPQLAAAVLKNNAVAGQAQIHLKGLLVGNPLFDVVIDTVYSVTVFLWSHGLMSEATYDAIISNCKQDGSNETDSCERAVSEANTQSDERVNAYDVLADVCISSASASETRRLKKFVNHNLATNLDVSLSPCIEQNESVYLNLPEVQKALHARTMDWSICSTVLNYTNSDISIQMLPVLKDLVSSGLRLWVFSGDQDSVIPLIGTRQLVGQVASELNLNVTSSYRVWLQGQQVGGWTLSWGNLTYATVRGAGHMVPATQPSRALQLFTSFISGMSLPRDDL